MKRKLVAFLPFTAILLLALFRYLLFSGSGVECNVRIREGNEGFMSKVQLKLEDFRSTVIDRTERILPSPHAELLLGMVIGVDNFGKLPKFKQMLKDTGTIHVVVVSGFNVSLVFNMVMRLLGTRYKARNLILGLSATFVYSVVSGFDPPVVRAWIMGSLVSIGKYYGRVLDVFHVIFFTAGVLVLYDPCYLESMSFQLSFLATIGLVMFSERIKNTFSDFLNMVGIKPSKDNVIVEDFSATVSAQLLVWPIISYLFGTVSIFGFVVNTLVLWTVPLITSLGFAIIFLLFASEFLARYFVILIYPFLDLFYFVVSYFSGFEFISIDFNIGLLSMMVYFLCLLTGYFVIVSSNRSS